MRYFILLLLFGIRTEAAPIGANKIDLWNCSISAELSGDAEYYRRWGRDSLRGRGEMKCYRAEFEVSRWVTITFSGIETGIGINSTTKINFSLVMVTSADPTSLVIYVHVANQLKDSAYPIQWRNESENTLPRSWGGGRRPKWSTAVFAAG